MRLLPTEDQQAEPREQQQPQYDAAERGVIELAERFEAGPCADSKRWQSDHEEAERVATDHRCC